jgi:hypothetical protein
MTTIGYSGKSLIDKLGFNPGDTVLVDDTPTWYSELLANNGVEIEANLPATHAHLFCDSKATLQEFLDSYELNDIVKSLWVSWPKKSSGVKTDVSEQDLRDAILPFGWVDVKVAAIDETWSGLKFLRRKS